MTWNDVISFKQTDCAYEAFLNKFASIYDKNFWKNCGYGKIVSTEKLVNNKGNSKIVKNKVKAIW